MNIFILDTDIQNCAQYHCDQHVTKMTLESVQILCTALNKKGFVTPYKSTYVKHPCVLWVERSYANFRWLRDLALALNAEYRYRFDRGKDHASIAVLERIADYRYDDAGLTGFVQAMPEPYQVPVTPYWRTAGFIEVKNSASPGGRAAPFPNGWVAPPERQRRTGRKPAEARSGKGARCGEPKGNRARTGNRKAPPGRRR